MCVRVCVCLNAPVVAAQPGAVFDLDQDVIRLATRQARVAPVDVKSRVVRVCPAVSDDLLVVGLLTGFVVVEALWVKFGKQEKIETSRGAP